LNPFTGKTPFVTGERRVVKRERGRVIEYRRRRRGKRPKEGFRKGG